MIIDMSYWTRVLKRILYVIFILIGLYLALKLSVFYMPFLIAFIISLIMEPLIRLVMRKTKLTRRASSIIIFIIVSLLILGSLIWGIFTLFSEASNLLEDLNYYIDKGYKLFQDITNNFHFEKIHLPDEIMGILQSSTGDIFENISQWARNVLNGLINVVSQIPNIAIYFVITVMSLYFMCVDKIYILDQIEHHLPKTWVMRLGKHMRDLIKTLGGYLKAQATLILVSFIISIIGLYILKFAGFAIEFPLLIAFFYLMQSMVELRNTPFLWITDLSSPDKLFVFPAGIPILGGFNFNLFPIVMALTSYLSMKLQPSSSAGSGAAATQMKMMTTIFPRMA